MTGEIHVLNVGDGDAILVHLTKPGAELVLVIDGGEPGCYAQTVKPVLEGLLQRTGKAAPDLVIATHYDSDHIGGLIPLVKDYACDIQQVWVHRAPALTARAKLLVEAKRRYQYMAPFEVQSFEADLLSENRDLPADALLEQAALVLESLNQLEELLGLVPPSKIREVFHNDCFPGWPELRVLGPTPAYYASLFPPNKPLTQLLREEFIPALTEDQQSSSSRFKVLASYNQNPCDFLKTEEQTQLTATNKASIILALDGADGRYLFTGDAGIASFKAIPNWQKELADVFWLKVPHHGSDNNISTELIDKLRPVHADNSGDRYEDAYVMGCIARNSRSKTLRSTKNNGHLLTRI